MNQRRWFNGLMLIVMVLGFIPLSMPPPIAASAASQPLWLNGQVWHVAPAGSDATGDGSAAAPFATLQKALSVAQNGDEIHVAQGVYYPDEGPGQSNNDQEATFQLKNGVALRGGYSPTFAVRDWTVYRTVLSGDLDGDDINTDNNFIAETWNDIVGNNAYHVVTGIGVSETTVLDGFIITAGSARGSIIPQDRGGGIYAKFSAPLLANLIIVGNTANYGGGIATYYSTPSLVNTVLAGNQAAVGGGMHNDSGSNPVLKNVTIAGNSNRYGTIYNIGNMTLHNTIVWEGLIYCEYGGSITAYSSNIQGSGGSGSAWDTTLGTDGGGNIDADPLFVDASNGDYRLQAGSPAIDTGDNSVVTVRNDLDGNSRIFGGAVDMGAYEFTPATLTALYVLAFDNAITSTVYLDAFYNETMTSLVQASSGHPEKTAIVLVDRSGSTPDAIFKIHDGIMTNITAQWPGMTPEVNATDGVFLGNFVWWARTHYPAARTTLTMVGHGLYAPFESEDFTFNTLSAFATPAAFARALNQRLAQQLPTALPMPMKVGGSPNWTDVNRGPGLGPNILSTYDASEMLRIGSNNGASPLEVTDFSLMCFSASMEMFYPLRAYTRMLTGGPNYNFFSPDALAAGFTALDASQPPAQMATALIAAYHAALPQSEHPRVLSAVDTTHLNYLKERLDWLSYLLKEGLSDPVTRAAYRDKILAAYQASLHYDTTGCSPQDWSLCPPDAMVDIKSFALQLQAQFGALSPVGLAAGEVAGAAQDAVLTKVQQNGIPWFGAQAWDFTPGVGLSLYADFGGLPNPNAPGGVILNGISHWYTTDNTNSDNPHPYEFITSGAYGATWAEVLHSYWAGTPITTELCLPAFPNIREPGEVAALQVLFPIQGWVKAGTAVTPQVVFSTATVIHNPTLAITITQGGNVVYTDTVYLGYRAPGTYTVAANHAWTPATVGPFALTFKVDSRNQIVEANEANNLFTMNDKVQNRPPCARPTLAAQIVNGQQWFTAPQIPVNLAQTAGLCSPVTQMVAQYYYYQTGQNPATQIPVLLSNQTINMSLPQNAYPLALPPNAPAGVYVVYLWPFSNLGGYGYPVELTFNYTPPATTLNSAAEHFYRFTVNAGEQVNIACQAGQGSAQVYVWEPGNPATALTLPCNGNLPLDPTQVGEYIVSVQWLTGAPASYTLTATRGNGPLAAQAAPTSVERVNRPRPVFAAPLPELPTAQSANDRTLYLPLVINTVRLP